MLVHTKNTIQLLKRRRGLTIIIVWRNKFRFVCVPSRFKSTSVENNLRLLFSTNSTWGSVALSRNDSIDSTWDAQVDWGRLPGLASNLTLTNLNSSGLTVLPRFLAVC